MFKVQFTSKEGFSKLSLFVQGLYNLDTMFYLMS